MFIEISERHALLHKCKAPLEDFLVTVLLPHQAFHWPLLITMVRF